MKECGWVRNGGTCLLEQENNQLKEDIKNLIKIISKNCDELEATEEEFESLYRWENE